MRDAPFLVHEPPAELESPLIVEVPHAGLVVPPAFMPEILASPRAIGRDADLYVDELYEDAPTVGATLLVARVSRYVVDLNRAEGDVDAQSSVVGKVASSPRGVVWRLTTDGERALAGPLSAEAFEARMRELYRPYHAALQALIDRKRGRFGHAVVLAAHSMPSVARAARGDATYPRADVVPGTQGRTSAAARFIDAVDAHARASGFSVAHDEPYKGGFTTQNYGRPADGVHVVQVELARRLYMDERTYRRLPDDFDATRVWCRELTRALAVLSPAARA